MTYCKACGKPVEETAPYCPHCAAAQNGTEKPVAPSTASNAYTNQTHLFLVTDTRFSVRWTYWVWWVVAVVGLLLGGNAGFFFGCGVMGYLFVSAILKRKQWQHQQLLDAMKTGK